MSSSLRYLFASSDHAALLTHQPSFFLSLPTSVNGSNSRSRFDIPVSDGIVPTLTDLEGDVWADQLVTASSPPGEPNEVISIDVAFPNEASSVGQRVDFIDVVMFNCPEWSIGARVITITGDPRSGAGTNTLGLVPVTSESCERLVHSCVPISTDIFSEFTLLHLNFLSFIDPGNFTERWVHIGEVIFIRDGECPTNLSVASTSTGRTSTTMKLVLSDHVWAKKSGLCIEVVC